MRTQQEIKTRFEAVNDFFGTQKGDLVDLMDFENAKPHLNEEYIEKVESGAEQWEQTTDVKKQILEYLPFAYGKAEDERGLSAARSMLHFTTWIWFDDPEFFEQIAGELEDYYDYGIPQLDKISAHYGYERN